MEMTMASIEQSEKEKGLQLQVRNVSEFLDALRSWEQERDQESRSPLRLQEQLSNRHPQKPTKDREAGTTPALTAAQKENAQTATQLEMNSLPPQIWFRGQGDVSFQLIPNVYRPSFVQQCQKYYGQSSEDCLLNLEREVLREFRTYGAMHFDPDNLQMVYFLAQHHGLPTRLLDWTSNPLAALYFACIKHSDRDGCVYFLNPMDVLPKEKPETPEFPVNVVSMRHPFAIYALNEAFWVPNPQKLPPLILPIRPDNRMGRIERQSSCFTLHMKGTQSVTAPSLRKIVVPQEMKANIVKELLRLNIDEFSIFADLDHLSKRIRRVWNLEEPLSSTS